MEACSRWDEGGIPHELLLEDFLCPIMSGLIALAFSLEVAYLGNRKPIFTANSEPNSD